MKILISNSTHASIESIFEYLSKFSITSANKFLQNIYSRIYELEFFPYIGRHIPDLKNIYFRELIYEKYRIIYVISKKRNLIYVHTVINSKQNFKPIFDTIFNDFLKFLF